MKTSFSRRIFRPAITPVLLVIDTGSTLAAKFVDAAGRTAELPDHVAKVVAACPPASIVPTHLAEDENPSVILGRRFCRVP